jgi:hypothetical protein
MPNNTERLKLAELNIDENSRQFFDDLCKSAKKQNETRNDEGKVSGEKREWSPVLREDYYD